jgi:large subunit ribosomal protein L31
MKDKIHPQFHTATKVSCACGHSFTTGSTKESLYTEICSNCHPFYTGKQKLIDTTGSVDKFKKRLAAAATLKSAAKPKKPRKSRTEKTAK